MPRGDDDFLDLSDLVIGSTITIYGRTFHIIDAKQSTKQYLKSHGYEMGESTGFPKDAYEEKRSVIMSRETGKDPNVRHNIQKNPMKEFAEAMLGQTVRAVDCCLRCVTLSVDAPGQQQGAGRIPQIRSKGPSVLLCVG